MALVYPSFSILSVGMSCQTSEQIEHHKPMLDEIVGQEGIIKRTPFDALICPTVSAAELIRRGNYFPQDPETELSLRNGKWVWDDTGAIYFHIRNTTMPAVMRHIPKFQHMSDTMMDLATRPVLAIWSNSQANLEMVKADHNVSPQAKLSEIAELQLSLTDRMPKSHLFVVARKDRIDPDDPLPAGSYADYDPSTDRPRNWKGNHDQWATILTEALNSFARSMLASTT